MTSRSRKLLSGAAGAIVAAMLGACGAGTPVTPTPLPERIEVRVSAGAPVAGAVVTVYAISDITGLPDGTVGAGGVLGSAGPTDSSGGVTITLSSRGYSGPVQLVAGGPSLFYADPTVAAGAGSSTVIQVPATFSLSSYVARFSGAAPVVPVTLLTTLADRAALAWARGRHPAQRTPSTITAALAARDPLFVAHVTKDAAAWNPGTFRTTVPAPLVDGSHTLVDAAYAALFDLALNQLARHTASRVGSSAVTAVTIAQLLQDDLDADGRFDGRGVGGLLLAVAGNPPVALDEQLLRVPLATALDAWIRNTDANRSGISQADLVSARVYEALTTDASDLFGGPPSPGVFDPVDRTPPVLAFAASPPAFWNQQTVTLVLQATDATGVRGVFARSGQRQFPGSAVDGVWRVPVELVPGHNAITIWGEDTAQAGNTGLGAAEPHQLTLDVVLDTAPPTAVHDATFASYFPEQDLLLAMEPDGTPRLPAALDLGGRPRREVTPSADIIKMATTLSAGGPLDVAELEGENRRNIPVLRFAVPFDPALEAPIVSATYALRLSCTGCDYPERTGALLQSPHVSPGLLYFDLPLATETLPDLGTVSGTATVSARLSLADAAGNQASAIDGGSYTVRVAGPRLLVAEDTSYGTVGDPRSTFRYAARTPDYRTLFDAAALAFLPDRQVRLVKYVLTNPWPVPVLADVRLSSGAWTATETWRGEAVTMPNITYTADGFSFTGTMNWAATCNNFQTFPCGGTTADQDTKFPVHAAGSTTQYTCEPKRLAGGASSPWLSAPADLVGSQQGSAAAELRAFLPGAPWDAAAAPTLGSALVVPAASATAPGRLHVYVTRPAGQPRTIPLTFGSLNPSSTAARFETWEWDRWLDTNPARFSCTFATFTIIVSCSICGQTIAGCLPCAVPVTVTNSWRQWFASRHVRFLASAEDNVSGVLSVAAQGLVPDGSRPFGEPSVQASNIDVRRTISH